jgi:fumarate hydratase class I
MVAVTSTPQSDAGLIEHLVELIRCASTRLPPDVMTALEAFEKVETEPRARNTLLAMVQNVSEAWRHRSPTCQDTGTLIFEVDYPEPWRERRLRPLIEEAVREATRRGYLRPNTVDSLSGKTVVDNVFSGSPSLHFHEVEGDALSVRLMQKGGGCENVGAQYSLPDERLAAGRDLEGVRRCILDAVHQAQGKGCSPGTVGVCIGGDRATSYVESKRQFWRKMDDANSDTQLAELERRVVAEANTLGVGPMGFGGKTTLLGCKIGTQSRLPASYFVSVSYMCWAYRRAELRVLANGESVIHQ